MLQSTVVTVDFAANAKKRGRDAALSPAFEGVMPFNSEDEALCRLLAQERSTEPPEAPAADAHPRTARRARGKPAATLAVAMLAGFFAGALWKA